VVSVHLEGSEKLERKHDRCEAKRKALKHDGNGLHGIDEEELEYYFCCTVGEDPI